MQMIKTCLLLFFLLPLMLFSDPLEKKLSDHIIYNKEGANPIGYLKLSKDNPIQESTYLYVKFAIEEFKKYKVPFVVFNIDSPGGEVFAALKISQELKKLDSQDGIPVVAFIDNWALSAGALMAYSCRFIGITPDASMGAAEPVLMAEQGKMETASEKVNSALRAEFANAARFFGRDPLIAEAMVDKDIILVIRSGQVCRLESETDIITTGKNPDKIISRKGKLLTLDAMQLMNLGVADFEVPYQPLDAATTTGAMIPFSECLLSKQPFFHQIPDAYLIDYQSSKISFFSFLANPLVASLLFMGLLVGVYGEMSHPGFGVFGCIALVCLSLILLSSFAASAIHWLELIALGVGVILLAIELFVLPGFGFFGVLGIILSIGGIIAMMLPYMGDARFSFDPAQMSLAAIDIVNRLGYIILAMLVSLLIMGVLSRFLSKRKVFFKKMVLTGEMDKENGFVAGVLDKNLPAIGSVGTVFSSLRPFGKVIIDGMLLDACAQTGSIEKGQSVEVVHLEGGKIVVRPKRGL